MKNKRIILGLSIVLIIFLSLIMAYGLEDRNIGTLNLDSTYTWMATKHSGEESLILDSYVHEQFSGRTQLCLVAKEGIPPGQLPRSINIYDENDVFVRELFREKIDIEDSHVDGMWGFCGSFDYEIDPHYLRWGENSIIFEWIEIAVISYQTDWLELNTSLYSWSPPNQSTVDYVEVIEGEKEYDFVAYHYNLTPNEIYQYKYVFNSTEKIDYYGINYYIIKNGEGDVCYEDIFGGDCNSDEPKIYLKDICEMKMVYNRTKHLESIEGDYTYGAEMNCDSDDYYSQTYHCDLDLNPNCTYNLYNDNKTLEVTFLFRADENGTVIIGE